MEQRRTWKQVLAFMMTMILLIQMADQSVLIVSAQENGGIMSAEMLENVPETSTVSNDSPQEEDTSKIITIKGSVEYGQDDDWKNIIRPKTFGGKIYLTAYDEEGHELQTFETTTDPGQPYRLKFIHDGEGGGTYEILDVPAVLDTVGGKVSVSSYKVWIEEDGVYGRTENIVQNISAEGVNTFSNVILTRQPVVATIQVTKQLLGSAGETSVSFSMTVSAVNSQGTELAKKQITVAAGSSKDVQVPVGYTYVLKEAAKEGYSPLYYEINGTKNTECKIDVTTAGEVYPVTVVNASRNSKLEWQVEWVDNHNSTGRPTPGFQLQFRVGSEAFETVSENNMAELGFTEVPVATRKAMDLGQQDIERYCFEGLPTVTAEGEPITYQVITTDKEEEIGYLIEWNEERNKVTYTGATLFSVTMKWSDSATKDLRPQMEDVKGMLNLYSYTDLKYSKVDAEIVLTESEDGKNWNISVDRMLPKYTKDNESLTYVLVQGEIGENGTATPASLPSNGEDGSGYQTTYYNGTGSFGNVTDRCYNGQSIIQTLTGTIHFNATKIWKDEIGDSRPAATVTLWRYSMRDSEDIQIDLSRSARVIVQGKTGDLLMSYQLATSDTVCNETNNRETIDFLTHFENQLEDGYSFPKYDELGREYRYFVQEIAEETSNGKYETTYYSGATKTETGALCDGEIINTKVDKLAIKVNTRWNAPSTLKDIEGKEITFIVVGEDSEGNLKEIPAIEGKTTVSGFSSEQTTATTEFLINPYDENGKRYTILGIKEKEITGIDEDRLSYSEDDPTKVSFAIGNNAYVGSSLKTGEGISKLYGVNQYTYQVTNAIQQYKDYSIVKRWETGNGVTPRNLEFSLKAESVAGTASSKKYTVEFDKQEKKATIEIDGEEKTFDITESFSGGWTVWTVCLQGILPQYDEYGYQVDYYASEIIPTGKDWSHTNHSYSDGKTTVSNYNTESTGHSISVEKVWKDDGDTDHRMPVEVHVFDQNGTDLSLSANTVGGYSYKAVLSQANLWKAYIAVADDPGTTEYIVKEVKVGEYEVQEEAGESTVTTADNCYTVEYQRYGNGRTVITNTRTGLVDIHLTKNWLDGGNRESTRPDKVTFLIQSDEGEEGTKRRVELSVSQNQLADNPDQWSKTIENLPRYDEEGKLLSYTISEEDGANQYQQITSDTQYQEGIAGQKTTVRYECTNRLQGEKDFKVYNLWSDKATGGKSRPDVYLTLHQIDTETNEDIIYSNYGKQIWEPKGSESDIYNWKISIEDLPAYNGNGYAYTYYVVETMNDNGASTGMSYETFYCKPAEGGGPDRNRYNLDQNGIIENRAYDGDYIVNALSGNMTIDGEKTWKNTQGFTVNELPSPTIYLYRRLASESEAEGELNTEDAIASLVLDGQAKAENVANYGDENKTHFVFAEDKDGNPLPKYSPEGERYVYYLRETIPSKENVSLYTKENKNQSLINTFDIATNNRSIYVTKTWDRTKVPSESNEQEYPAVTLKLYRYEKPDDNSAPLTADDKKAKGVLFTKTINATEFEAAENGEVTVCFDNLLIYSPNGSKYYYYIEEEAIKGYSTVYYNADHTKSNEGIDIVDQMTLNSANKETSVSVNNIYDKNQFQIIQLSGRKLWDDYGNYFAYRPDEIEIELYRYTLNQTGQNNKVVSGKVGLTVVDSAALAAGIEESCIVWEKDADTWNYMIYNLRRYAPNGESYIYQLVEKPLTDKYYGTNDKWVGQKGQNQESGAVAMSDLTNRFTASCYVRKNWIDGDNKYGFRPKSITVMLQRSTDGNSWENVPNPKYTVGGNEPEFMQAVLTSENAIPNTNESSWQYTFKYLPQYKKKEADETEPVEYKYRCVETKLGGTAFSGLYDEEQVGSYTRTYTSIENNKTVIENSMNSTCLKVTKQWDDSNNLYQVRPEKLEFYLQKTTSQNPGQNDWENATDTDGQPIILTMTKADSKDGNTWVKTFDSLPVSESKEDKNLTLYYRAVEVTETTTGGKYPKVGEKIYQNYLVTEDGSTTGDESVWRFNTDTSMNESTIRNQMIVSTEISKVTVEKIWRNDSNLPAYDVTFELQKKEGDGAFVSFKPEVTKTIKTTNTDQKVSFLNLPGINADGEEISYQIVEKTTNAGYRSSMSAPIRNGQENVYQCTNVELMDFTVSKKWNNNLHGLKPAGQYGFVSEGVLQSTSDNHVWSAVVDSSGEEMTFQITDDDSYTFKNLPRYTEDGTRINYRGIETKVNGVTVSDENALDSSKSYTVAYTHKDKTSEIDNTLVTVPIEITKVWDDRGNVDRVRPSDITLTLYADYDGEGDKEREKVDSSQYTIVWDKSEADKWKATINGLPRYAADGTKEIVYSLEEDDIDRYSKKTDAIKPDGEDGKWQFIITNTLDLKLTVKKFDQMDETPLAGTEFKLYEALYDEATGTYTRKAGEGTLYVTGTDGITTIYIQNVGCYELVEENASGGYTGVTAEGMPAFDYFFNVTDDDLRQTKAITSDTVQVQNLRTGENLLTAEGLANERKKGTLIIYKEDGDTGASLDGVTFTLSKKREGNIFENAWNFITGHTYEAFAEVKESISGVTTIENLDWGEYKLVETATLDGYVLTSDEYFFSVNAETVEQTIELTASADAESLQTGNVIKNYKNHFMFIKQSAGNDAVRLEGGLYRIVKVDNGNREEVSFYLNETGASDKKNRLTAGDVIYGLPVGTYEIEELSAPAGYCINENPVVFRIDDYGVVKKENGEEWDNNQVIMQDVPVELAIRKVDAENNFQLMGAEFSVTGIFVTNEQVSGTVSTISGLTVENFGEKLKGKLIASSGTNVNTDMFLYELKETCAPESYSPLKETIIFKVLEDGGIELVQATNLVSVNNEPDVPVLTVRNTKSECSFTVTKEFKRDEEWKETIRPRKVTLQLYARKEGTEEKKTVGNPVVLDITKNRDSYSYTFENLPTHEYSEQDGVVTAAKLIYSVEETAVEPAEQSVFYDVKNSVITISGNNLSQTIVNTAEKLNPAGILKISKTNLKGPQNALFRMRILLKYNGEEVVFKDSYQVYQTDLDADETNDVLVREQKATDGYVELKGGEYVKIVLPKGIEYHVEEELDKIGNTAQYCPSYTNQDGTIRENTMIEAAVTNQAVIYTAIENETENESDRYPDGARPKNAGGVVGIATGHSDDEGTYDKVEYQEGKLSVFWFPEKDWQFTNFFTITYREYDGSNGAGVEHTIMVNDFLDENGKVKDSNDSCYDELRSRYPDMEIGQTEDGMIVLRLANYVDGMPYLNMVHVLFTPTLAILNTTPGHVGGQVKVENGQFHDSADGKGLQGEKRYPETKVYAKADDGYHVDLTNISIGNVDADGYQVNRSDKVTGNADTVGEESTETGGKVILTLDETKSFKAQLPYKMAGREDVFTIQGHIEVIESDESGNPSEIVMVLDDMPVPIDVGVLFAKNETQEDKNDSEVGEDTNADEDHGFNMTEINGLRLNGYGFDDSPITGNRSGNKAIEWVNPKQKKKDDVPNTGETDYIFFCQICPGTALQKKKNML